MSQIRLHRFAAIAICLLLPLLAFSQEAGTDNTVAAEQMVRIPVNLPECMVHLDSMLDDATKASLRENGALSEHFGVGMWMRNIWGLWKGEGDSPLRAYFKNHGILHPDDMSHCILECYVRHLNGEDVDFERMLDEARCEEEEWRKGSGPIPSIP